MYSTGQTVIFDSIFNGLSPVIIVERLSDDWADEFPAYVAQNESGETILIRESDIIG
jgi:hypothetical protein